MKVYPDNYAGKIAVGFTLTYIILVVVFFMLMAIGLVDFETGHWWDYTLLFAVPTAVIAFIASIKAIRREKTVLTYCSLVIGGLIVLFLLTHSLYIHD